MTQIMRRRLPKSRYDARNPMRFMTRLPSFVLTCLVAGALVGCPAEPPEASGSRPRTEAARRGNKGAQRGERGGQRARAPSPTAEEGAETWGPLQVRVLGEGDGPVVMLLHGFGARGDDLVRLAHSLDVPEGTRFVLPAAPVALPRRGRAWWMINRRELIRARATNSPRDLSEREPEGLAEARQAVLQVLDEAERRLEVSGSNVVMAGFSQGAMLAMDVALHAPEPPAAVAMMSGAPLARDQWQPRLDRLDGVPVLISHGRNDRLLSFEAAEGLARSLEEKGARVTFLPFEGGHRIPPATQAALSELVRDALIDRPVGH